MTRFAPATRVIAAAGASLVLLAGVQWGASRQATVAQGAAALVAQTREVQSSLLRLLSTVQDIETGARGFVISGEPSFLEPYLSALKAIDREFESLRNLLRDNPHLQPRLTALRSLIDGRVRISRRHVELRQTSGFEAARQSVAEGSGRAAMDRIRAEIAALGEEEQTLLQQRADVYATASRRTQWLALAATLLSVALLAAAFATVFVEARRRQLIQLELDRFFTLSIDLLAIADTKGYFRRLNPAFTRTLGWAPDELLARPFLEFVHPEDHAATQAEVETLSRGVPTIRFENRYRCRDGSWRWLSWNVQPVAAEELIYATARDMTVPKAMEAALRQVNADLEQRSVLLDAANKELEAFSYSVSHDLRAPLRHIHGYVEMLQRATDGQLSVEAQRCLKIISEASVEMGQLIDDLLALSRSGRSELNVSVLQMDTLVDDAIRNLEMVTAGRSIIWKREPLPPVLGDRTLITQVLANLIGNAVKYTRRRDPAEIEIGCAGEHSERVTLYVRDNGAGFDQQYAGKLFGVFQRLHRADEFDGTGIGLAIVKRIIARHGGRVWGEGEPDHGATFYFTLKRSSLP